MRILVRLLVVAAYVGLVAADYAVKHAHATGQRAKAMHAATQFFANPVAIGAVCLALLVVFALTVPRNKDKAQQQSARSWLSYGRTRTGRN